ncbi:MAG: F0F1 ATP synthase subunit B [Bacteroidales bacterium]|nr:F0F1 ATP synthase subunit B [Bacteroidales bacterium]
MNLMSPDGGLLFWMTVIFAIVFFILAKFGFPVITGTVERRTKRIDDALKAARKAEESLAGLAREQEQMAERARAEQARILQDAAAERDRLIAAAQQQAAEEAMKIMAEAKARIREEKEAALRDVRREVVRISLAVAEEVLRKELASEKGQEDFAAKMFDEASKLHS